MEISELSGQIAEYLKAGEYARAHYELLTAWNEASEFGRVNCEVPEYSGAWVKFKTRGYPFGLRKQWDESSDNIWLIETILKYVDEWSLTDFNGQPIELPDGARPAALLDNLEDAVMVWLIGAFRYFWRATLLEPRKN